MKLKRFILTSIVFLIALFGFSITAYAQTTVVENTIYWETSENGGSGRHNTVTESNPYISEDRKVIVNGYSYLTEEGKIIDSFYDSSATENINLPMGPEEADKVMLHIHSTTNRLGWVDGDNVLFELVTPEDTNETKEPEPQKKTAEEFAESINEKEGKTLILVDQSGSMSEFVEKSTKAFNSLDLTDVTIMVFAESFLEISANEINDSYSSIGVTTDIYSAMNQSEGYQNIVLISDLDDNHDNELLKFSSVKTLEIMCPNANYPVDKLDTIRSSWSNVEITIDIIK